jgi:hypothetical protein
MMQSSSLPAATVTGERNYADASVAEEGSAIGAAVVLTVKEELLPLNTIRCEICQENHAISVAVRLPCDHAFCAQSIGRWAQHPTRPHQPSCPVCRDLLFYQKCRHRPPRMFYQPGRQVVKYEFEGRCPPCRGVPWGLEQDICSAEDIHVGRRALKTTCADAASSPTTTCTNSSSSSLDQTVETKTVLPIIVQLDVEPSPPPQKMQEEGENGKEEEQVASLSPQIATTPNSASAHGSPSLQPIWEEREEHVDDGDKMATAALVATLATRRRRAVVGRGYRCKEVEKVAGRDGTGRYVRVALSPRDPRLLMLTGSAGDRRGGWRRRIDAGFLALVLLAMAMAMVVVSLLVSVCEESCWPGWEQYGGEWLLDLESIVDSLSMLTGHLVTKAQTYHGLRPGKAHSVRR